MVKILVVEDDIKLNEMVCKYLRDNGYDVEGYLTAKSAYSAMHNDIYGLIVSAVRMSEIDGFEFVETIRKVNKKIPIVFMAAKNDWQVMKRGYLLGADDYMVKPINLEELLFRIKVLLRRTGIENDRRIAVGNLMMDADERIIEINGEEISFTTREFNLLYKMLSFPKKTFSRVQLLDEFWGMDCETNLRAVDVYMARIREKTVMCDGFRLITVRGIGYKAVLL